MKRPRRKLTRHATGFTLVELMVSLVAGLFIAIAVIALSRTATKTFHEQARIAVVESTLRTASERLRNDLLRASFMSTGNIRLDPVIARIPGAATGSRYAALDDLQGLRVEYKASATTTHLLQVRNNGLAPDAVVVTGNLTSDDSYRAQWDPTNAGGVCGGPLLIMDPNADAAVMRLVGGTGWAALTDADRTRLVGRAFHPAGFDFAARVVDKLGCSHYVRVCGAGWNSANNRAWVELRNDLNNRAILTPTDTGNDTCGGTQMDEFSINPVHRVRWEVVANTNALLNPETGVGNAADKFNLTRELQGVDGAGNWVPALAAEIVAEYAIDLKFGAVVDDPTQRTGANPPVNIKVYDMDPDPASGDISSAATRLASTTAAGQIGPQSVRAVRYRISARAAVPDRQTWMSLFTATTAANSAYIARYCVDSAAASLATCAQFTRARTITSEVPLINQASFALRDPVTGIWVY